MSEHLQIVAAVLAVLVVGLIGYGIVFRDDQDLALVVTEVSGAVVRTTPEGQEDAATPGMALAAQELLTVGEGGRALLSAGDGEDTQLTLESRSSIRVLEVNRSSVRVELEGGQVSARVRLGSPTLSIQSESRTIRAQDADFSVALGEGGVLSVEASRGAVDLSGFGAADATPLQASQRLTALPGAAPVVGTVPEVLLRSVLWPKRAVVREDEVTLEGEATPYATVMLSREGLAPRQVRADERGHFQGTLPLQEGENRVRVEIWDAFGRKQVAEQVIERDTRAPTIDTSITWGGD